jgi:hypothetical protein
MCLTGLALGPAWFVLFLTFLRISAIFDIFPLFSDFFSFFRGFSIFSGFFGKRADHRRSTAMVSVRIGAEGSASWPKLRPNFKKEPKMAKSPMNTEPKSELSEFES